MHDHGDYKSGWQMEIDWDEAEKIILDVPTVGGRLMLVDMARTQKLNALLYSLDVYEYMENGSLAQKLHSNMLDWGKRFDIAIGTAKGLAYLHEECLEWVLHCDVKPHNILLDSNCKLKVADFGLCKLLDRYGTHNTKFTVGHGNDEISWWKEQ
ncbi:putative receptor protein kinase ZmPK1 [Tanacetum coccineum]